MNAKQRAAVAVRSDSVLRRLYFDGSGANRFTPIYERTPVDELMAEEAPFDEENMVEHAPEYWPADDTENRLELRVLKAEEAAAVAEWARRRIMQWIFGDGPGVLKLAERALLLAFAGYKDLIGPADMTDFGEMLGKGKSAISARFGKLFRKPIIQKHGHAMTVPGTKSELSRIKYAANAAKHTPRRNLPRTEEEAEQQETEKIKTTKERRALLKKQQAEALKKEHADNAAFFDALKKTAAREF